MKIRSNKILGLAVGQKSILLAEVAAKSGGHQITHFAEFVYPEGMSLATPEKLGESLAQFMRGRKFSTRDVVIGLPAKRLVTRRKDVPPATPANAINVLRLQAESDFSSDMDNLVVDFAGKTSTSVATTVLLIATARNVIEQCEQMAKSAGLKLQGITATTAALGRASSRLPGGDGLVLNLTSNGAELVMQHGPDTTYLRHLNVVDSSAPDSIGALAGEIRRTVAALPRNGTPMTLALWNSATTSDPTEVLQQRLSMPVTSPQLRKLVSSDAPEANDFAAAATVALTAMESSGLPVDFLNSRLSPPKDTTKRDQILLGCIFGIILLAFVGHYSWQYFQLSTKLDTVNASIKKLDAQKKTASAAKARLLEAVNWIPVGPRYVACWRDLTNLFPDNGGTIWADQLQKGTRGDTWTLSGKCSNENEAYALRDRMLQDVNHFANPIVTSVTEEPKSGQISFEMVFSYLGAE